VNPTVFIVDDDASYLSAAARLLRASGFAVRPFNSALEFLALLDPQTPGCALVDLQMPELNGLDLQAALKRTRKAIPVIFLTGRGNIPSTVRRSARCGREQGRFRRGSKS